MIIERATSLGGGVIGASWTTLFLAHGIPTTVYDVDPRIEGKVRTYIERAWPVMSELGLTANGTPDAVTFVNDPRSAVEGADFIQESVPERATIKHELFRTIEPVVGAEAVVSSSASGLTLAEMQVGWSDPKRFVLGHPFNPPHLIPLVEVMGNQLTDESAVVRAEEVYAALGKTTIRLKKPVSGHVANRLQAALWREAIHLVREGVVSVEDADKAVSAGPGIRWAVAGPTTIWNLAAGERGLEAYIEHFADSFNGWWDEMGDDVRFDTSTKQMMIEGIREATAGKSQEQLTAERDQKLIGVLKGVT